MFALPANKKAIFYAITHSAAATNANSIFCYISDAAVYFEGREYHEADESANEVLNYFTDTDEQLFIIDKQHDETDNAPNTWIAEMFVAL